MESGASISSSAGVAGSDIQLSTTFKPVVSGLWALMGCHYRRPREGFSPINLAQPKLHWNFTKKSWDSLLWQKYFYFEGAFTLLIVLSNFERVWWQVRLFGQISLLFTIIGSSEKYASCIAVQKHGVLVAPNESKKNLKDKCSVNFRDTSSPRGWQSVWHSLLSAEPYLSYRSVLVYQSTQGQA